MQEQFFSVTHATPVNDPHAGRLSSADAGGPGGRVARSRFCIASAITSIDRVSSRLLRSQNESMHDLVEIINPAVPQDRHDHGLCAGSPGITPEHRFHTLRFGAGQLTYLHPTRGHGEAPALHQIVRLKIFLREEASAVYCYGGSCSRTPES